jgi:hypothetical protein
LDIFPNSKPKNIEFLLNYTLYTAEDDHPQSIPFYILPPFNPPFIIDHQSFRCLADASAHLRRLLGPGNQAGFNVRLFLLGI